MIQDRWKLKQRVAKHLVDKKCTTAQFLDSLKMQVVAAKEKADHLRAVKQHHGGAAAIRHSRPLQHAVACCKRPPPLLKIQRCSILRHAASVLDLHNNLRAISAGWSREKCKSCTKKPYSRVIFFFLL